MFDPWRDARIETASGEIAVRVEGRDARYRFAFDGAKPQDEQVSVAAVAEPEGLHAGTSAQAKRFAIHALRGAYHTVVYYLPPIALTLSRSLDRKNFVVTAPPFRHDTSVSYSLDSRELVVTRGAWSDRAKEVVRYEWQLFRGRYLLDKAAVVDGATTEYVYGDHDGTPMLDAARLRDGDRVFDVRFAYEKLVARPR